MRNRGGLLHLLHLLSYKTLVGIPIILVAYQTIGLSLQFRMFISRFEREPKRRSLFNRIPVRSAIALLTQLYWACWSLADQTDQQCAWIA